MLLQTDRVVLYFRYCQNLESAQTALSEVGDNHPILLGCQKELGHQLPLSSYLLKPMQRLTKYQLLLKDLSDTFTSCANGQFELEESVEAMVEVIKAVNDSLHQINIKVRVMKCLLNCLLRSPMSRAR